MPFLQLPNFNSQEQYEKFVKAKKRKSNRARKNDKNVVAQCKAEDVEGYEGEKPINDLLESLGEATTTNSEADKKQKIKQRGGAKEKRDKKKRGDKAPADDLNGVADDADQEEEEEIIEVEIKEIREVKEKKKSGGSNKGSKAVQENGINVNEFNQNIYLVSTDDDKNLKLSENLAASSDSLNFVPVTGKKKAKKQKEDQDKQLREYSNKKSKDEGRPLALQPASQPGTGYGRTGAETTTRPSNQNRDTARQAQTDSRRTSNYSLRSREVQISPEPEKAVSVNAGTPQAPINHGPEHFPALDILQEFPALPSAGMTDKPHIHSAWARKPSTGSSATPPTTTNTTTPPTTTNTTTVAVNEPTTVPAHSTSTSGEHPQPPCDKLSVTKPPTPHPDNKSDAATRNNGNKNAINNDDVFHAASALNQAGKDHSSTLDAAKNINRPSASQATGPSPDYSRSSEITCDKSVVSDEATPAPGPRPTTAGHINSCEDQLQFTSATRDTAGNNNNSVSPAYGDDNTCVSTPPSVCNQSATDAVTTSSNPLLTDDTMEGGGFIIGGGREDNDDPTMIMMSRSADDNSANNNSIVSIAMGDDYSCHQAPGAGDHQDMMAESRFQFDTRTSVVGSEAGAPPSLILQEEEAEEISFGFDINYQLVDASITSLEMDSESPGEMNAVAIEAGLQGVGVVNGGAGANIASVDKAILSFSTVEGAMVAGAYHYMNPNIPPGFAANCIPVMAQIHGSGTPGCIVEGRPLQGEPKEVVSPESGICSPLSWQGEGEEAGNNTTSPPIQPGSYPRRQENRDFICELKKNLNYEQLRGSSRSPSPQHSARSGSAGSYTRADISFTRSEDSGLNTTRRSLTQTDIITSASPNHCEIVSFLQNNWEEFSKDKKAKVYGDKKEQRR
jgi:hypothetical protein